MVQDDSSMGVELELQDGRKIPVASMVESIVGCKWTVRLLQLCAEGHNRPGMVLRACPGLSAKVMNERWRKMIRFGIMRRRVFGLKPPVEVEYQLTPFGRRFLKILDEVRKLQEAVDGGAISKPSQSRKKVLSGVRVMPSNETRRRSASGSSSKGS
ncbi:MAG TPA: HxlR family transcriptional regulator [Nitrospiraceae bacterium]|nr:HxlR family transcriptional regulator [Nitrospiraceae bacterium]